MSKWSRMRKPSRRAKEPGFYEPAASVAELERLEDVWRQERTNLLRVLWGAAAIAALLIALNLVGTAFDTSASLNQRAWSLFPVFAFAMVLVPVAVRDFRLRREALIVQQRLLGHRGLLGWESEIQRAEDRLVNSLATHAPGDRRTEFALAAARRMSRRRLDELSRIGLERRLAEQPREQEQLAERRLIALLDAYGHAIETTAINIALDPAFVGSGTAAEALDEAKQLLAET